MPHIRLKFFSWASSDEMEGRPGWGFFLLESSFPVGRCVGPLRWSSADLALGPTVTISMTNSRATSSSSNFL